MGRFLIFTLAGLAIFSSEAGATKLFKGIAVITARSNTPACVQEYDIFESYVTEYRANVGSETTPERLVAVDNGALMLTSNDATPTLRGAGTASISGNAYAQPISFPSVNVNLTISPVTATTTSVTIAGTVNDLGIAGCNVTFRASLTLLPPGGY